MNLGEQVVLQLYEKHKLDEYVDYLSTIESVVTGRARNRRAQEARREEISSLFVNAKFN